MNEATAIADPLIGTRVDGRYLLLRVLGRGGMGVVYEARHEQLGRSMALKALGPAVASDPVAVERFLREARTASQLRHANIIDVTDLGQLPDGRPYLVMPKLDGGDLASLLERNGPQEPWRVVELLRGAAAAIDFIHTKGYVHRDIKPENLMHVVHEDGSEAVLLLDFGIVAFAAQQARRITTSGDIFGTPAYLPPEVLQQDEPSPRWDVYALATVAFELLTGRLPFDAATPLRVLQLKLEREAPRLGASAGHEFDADVEAVIAHGLARDPRQRCASAGELVQALHEAVQRSGSVPRFKSGLRQDTLPSPLRRPRSRPNARAVAAGALGVLLFAGAGVGALRQEARQAPLAQARTGQAAGALPPANPGPPVAAQLPNEDKPAAAPVREVPLSLEENASADSRVRPPTRSPKSAVAALPKLAPQGPGADPVARAAGGAEQVRAQLDALTKQAGQAALRGELARADALYAEALQLDPRSEAAWRGAGLTRERLGRTQAAIEAIRRALELAPRGPHAESLRARLAALGAAP